MADPKDHYHMRDGKILIEIKLADIMQVFDSLDPFPFLEKALDRNAEEFITESVKELPLKDELSLVIHLPEDIAQGKEAQGLKTAIKNHYAYRASATARELRQKFRQGRLSLVIGLAFLFVCLSINQALVILGNTILINTLREGFLIIGWVAMWEPINIFLYAWWPIRRELKVYEKIHSMDIEVLPLPKTPAFD
ncbi:MAG: hypothetical protein LUQ13_02675 [Methanomicrobiales archaeon]|nr:hypothetical protein [Methanomicrobiales archaeon]